MTDVHTTQLGKHYQEEGWLHAPGLIDSERTTRLRVAAEIILAQWRLRNPCTGEPGGFDNQNVMRHLNHPAFFNARRDLLVELLELAADPKILQLVSESVGIERPLFRCTSLFFNPLVSSHDGNWHRDIQFGKTIEQERDYWDRAIRNETPKGMQLQIPLVPSQDSEYVPRSHRRWDTDQEFHIRRADDGANCHLDMPDAIRVSLQPGDAVGFDPFGLHRGRYHTDKLRRTIMLTYCDPDRTPIQDTFTRQPWFLEEGYLDGLSGHASAFYSRFIDVHRDWWQQEQTQLTVAG